MTTEIKAEDLEVSTFNTGSVWFPNRSGIRLKHKPSGIITECGDERSQHRNRQTAYEKLLPLVAEWEKTYQINGAKNMTDEVKSIDMTPTWQGVLPVLLAGLEDGTAEGKRLARIELKRMAEAADSAKDALNVLLAVRETLQFANDSPNGPINDTIWMMHKPETLFDFIDSRLYGCPKAHIEPKE